jgi:hypothetical protein
MHEPPQCIGLVLRSEPQRQQPQVSFKLVGVHCTRIGTPSGKLLPFLIALTGTTTHVAFELPSNAGQCYARRMQRWAYATVMFEPGGNWSGGGKLDSDAFNAKLNEYGAEGWELVSVFDTNRGEGATRNVFAVFKRPAT